MAILACGDAPRSRPAARQTDTISTSQAGPSPSSPSAVPGGSAPVLEPATTIRDDPVVLQDGLLIAPFEDSASTLRGVAGERVRFRETPGSSNEVDIELDGVLYRRVWNRRIIPFDSTFAPYYVYDALAGGTGLYRGGDADVRDRASLASHARQLFAYHPYRDLFAGLECRAVHQLESLETEGKTSWPRSLACVDAYLRDFPSGSYRDELEWLGVRLRNAVYEFEGDPSRAISQIAAFRTYLDEHPRTTRRTEIEFTVARLCYMVYEMLSITPPDSFGLTAADRVAYRARAEEMLSRLARSTDPGVASRAIVLQYNLRQGRRIYANPNKW